MGKYDDAMYRYLSDNDRFADLFNAVLFDGRAVVRGVIFAFGFGDGGDHGGDDGQCGYFEETGDN